MTSALLENGKALSSAPGVALDSPVDPDLTMQLAAANESPESVSESFWEQGAIQLSRWNKLYPYQLLVVRAKQRADGETSHEPEPGWTFTLPVPPEALSISTPFAISTTATMGGIIEEHNGAPFRMISIRGTTGLLPARSSAVQQLGFSFFETVAGGVAAQMRRVNNDLDQISLSFSGSPRQNPNLHKAADFTDDKIGDNGPNGLVAKTTGYYQFRLLQRFLERYVAIKKTKEGRNLRLALATWKDQAVYLVTPQNFEASKNASSGMEYTYSLSLKGWRRITLDTSSFGTKLGTPVRRNPNALAAVLNTLSDARRVVQGLSKAASAAAGDVDRLIFEPLRETVMLGKDVLGLGLTLADLPDSIASRLADSWVDLQGQMLSTTVGGAQAINDRVKGQRRHGGAAATETKDMTTSRSLRARASALNTHPARKPFEDPKAALDLMSETPLNQLRIPPALQTQISRERARVQGLRRADFEKRRDDVRIAADRLAIALGAGDPTYEATYGVVVRPLKTTPTESDWEALYALNAAAAALDSLAATGDNEPSARRDSIDVMAGLARRSGIAFQVPVSKFAVPFPYGSTLEGLAALYLGDPQRWHEIAALNGLKEPYIDEVGFDLSLLTNGSINQVVVAPTQNLFIGQNVYLWSDAARRVKRRVVALRTVGTNLIVTVDGDPTMGDYKTSDAARLSAFLPDTVNSQGLIYIPSQQTPADDNAVTKSIPGVAEFDPMTAVGGVDLLLDSNNDLVITPDGDTRLAIGLTNIIQQVRIALATKRGTLLHHPTFGLPLEVGVSTAELEPSAVLGAVRRMLADEPSVSRVDAVRVIKDGPWASVDVAVTVKGTEQPVPISYKVRGDFQTAD